MQQSRYRAGLARVLGTAALASAASLSQADININGFATVGGGWYNGDSTGASFSGFDQDFSADPVTKLGLQFTGQINDKMSATAQLLAKGRDNYDIDATWAYLTYSVDDNWDVRAGRLRTPFFAYSDFLDVSYAYPWITPPSLVYRFDVDTVSGVDTIYRTSHGDWDASYQAYYGRLNDDTMVRDEETKIELTNFVGLNASFTKDWLTLRASVNRADVTYDDTPTLSTLLGIFEANGAAELAEQIRIANEEGIFWGVGTLVDYEGWLFNTEYTELLVKDQSVLSDDSAWYVMFGKRFEEITLHLTYAKHEEEPDFGIIKQSTIPLVANLARSALAQRDNSALTLGMRYDFAESTSFKVEVSQIEQDHLNDDGTLVAFALDTVF